MKIASLILAVLLSATLLCAQSTAPDSRPAPDAAVAKAMAELFAQDDPALAVAAQRAVLAAAGNDLGKLKAAIAADTAYEKLPAGWTRKNTQVAGRDNKKYDLQYFLRVPKDYDPKKSWPVMLVFHGQGGNGELAGKMTENMLGPRADEFILLAPTQAETNEHYSSAPHQEQSGLTPLAYARLHLNVDDDRIFLTGYSLGGHQSWHLATMYPRLWAASVPMAGVPWFEGSPFTATVYLENLAHLPLWAIWGELDRRVEGTLGNVDFCRQAKARFKAIKNETFVGTEIAGGGHGDCWPTREEFFKFIDGKKRQLPASFEHNFHMMHHARGYWLEATALNFKPMDLSQPINVRVTSKDPKAAEESIRQLLARKMFRISGKYDADTNTITVKCTNVPTARLYLVDGMADLSKPLTISFLGRQWKGKVPASPECVLKNYAATRDQTQLIVNEIDLDASGKATPKYPKGEERRAKGETAKSEK